MSTRYKKQKNAKTLRKAKVRKAKATAAPIVEAAPALQIIERGGQRELNREEIDLLKRTVAKGTTDDEFKLFLWVCRKHKLDPLTRQLHCVKRWLNKHHRDDQGNWVGGEQMTIQMGIDGYRSLAGRDHADYGGCDEPEYEFGTDKVPGTQMKIPVKATVRLWKKGLEHPVIGVAYWDEIAPRDLSDANAFFWKKMPKLMLAKCAEAQAIRKGYPELSDIYTDEEMHQANDQFTPGGRQVVEQAAHGTTAAAHAVAQKKLAEHAQGKPINPPATAPETPKPPEPKQQQRASASLPSKVVEIYPTKIGDLDAVAFVNSPALAFLCDNGLKDFTVWADVGRYRFMADEPEGVKLLAKVSSDLGIEVKRIAPPVATAASPAKQGEGVGCMDPTKAQIPPFRPPAPAPPSQGGDDVRREEISGKIEAVQAPRGQGKPMWVTVGGVRCTCWHKHVPGTELQLLELFSKAKGQFAILKVSRSTKAGTEYTNIEAIRKIGQREYDQHGPVRTMNDMGQTSFF